ncbi:hypothetical protein CE91St1_16470 [Parabacteroides goldsteinii]|nr:hypothetical protein [Parabacteroides goldsteinii]GKG72504.1 hypothetical protein CE91St1_16470 [Parabacteroides goldsteinii]GKG78398.1 hypothetical protein CE91St2_15900 [Parabacteroides goldsteinii]
MQTTTATKAGNAPDLLSGILSVQVRNEDKITEQDRLYCQTQQDLLYKTLDQIDRWYAIFKEDAKQYQEERKFHYEDNGKVSMRNFYTFHNDRDDYSHNEFKPFDLINDLVDKNHNANANFANRIIGYFNKTYNVSVPEYKIDEKTLRMGFRPVYETYVDTVIEHLGGKSFRETAEEELLSRFLKVVKPSCWSKVKPELKKDKITFPDILRFDEFYLSYNRNQIHYNYKGNIEIFCEGIAFGADDSINGSSRMIVRLDENDVDVSGWYDLTTTNAEQIKFYKNGRIDVRFKDIVAAESCFKRLRLDEITLRED